MSPGMASWGMVCHSFGCILALQMVVLMQQLAAKNDAYARLLAGLRFLAFFGPPFKGSALANLLSLYPSASFATSVVGRGHTIVKVQHLSRC